MKNLHFLWEKISNRFILITGVLTGLLFLSVSCDIFNTETDITNTFYKENQLSISQYIASNPDTFSILNSILDTTGLIHLFKTYGDYTFLAPTNSAFNAFFAEKGKSSFKDFEKDELTELVKYHVFRTRYLSGTFNMGIIESKTLTANYMVSSPSIDGSDIYLNKNSKIVTRDIELPNGILHIVDKVLKKPDVSIYGWLKKHESEYKIFIEALEKTGLDQMANKIDPSQKVFYTCFITSDKKYAESNINSFSDLAKLISPNNSNYSDATNILRDYVASHFTTEIFSMSNATEEQMYYGTVGGATLTFGFKPNTAQIKLNYHTSDFPEGLNIDEFNSNNLAANGIIHLMDTLFQVPKTIERINRLFVIVDVPGLPYDSVFDANMLAVNEGTWNDLWHRYWPRPEDGSHIPWARTNGWLTLNAPYSGFLRIDHHKRGESTKPQAALYGEVMPMFLNYDYSNDLFDITRKIPYIIPGKYRLIHYIKAGPMRGSVMHYWNGKPIGGMKNLEMLGKDFMDVELGIVEIKPGETEHYIRIKQLSIGYGFLVAFKFEPVN